MAFETIAKAQEVKPGQPIQPVSITVNDRAATREALIRRVRKLGGQFVERSEWGAVKGHATVSDWDYSMIALHHAGRSYSCGVGAEQMRDTQEEQIDKFEDFSYHFGISCDGVIYEGRDIRLKGSHVRQYNTGVIGIVLLNNLSTVEEGGDIVAWGRQGMEFLGVNTTNTIPGPQIDSVLTLISALKNVFVIKHFGGHREYPNQLSEGKICPGNVGMELVRNIRAKTQLLPPPTS
ncbi:TPA: N-acetylmuramoyl-L-alanine amidase [Pseudomonas aeruginosa]|nr:N-acetylmuramoyl-L-alanine amidase [Pseudomonas aeruginosa]HEJ1200888.1 N-acetylmuramoyl-L-alanine amidase [Pseudomonas aeruginosa]HEJ5395930.1 N-acetylmuramoyl-L-alanine amidase [Pseudomonas aeruginosa]